MEKISKLCDKLIKTIFIIAFFLVVFQLFGGILGAIAGILVCASSMYIFNKFDISHKKFLILLIGISLLIRVVAIIEIKNPQISDFKTLYDISEDFVNEHVNEKSQHYLDSFNYQIYFAFFQAMLLKICNKIVFLKLVNVILNILGILLMYRIMTRITQKKYAQISTFLYSVFVNTILYNNILSNQHMFLFLILMAFNLIFEKQIIKKEVLKFALVGFILGIANLIRPEAIVCVLTIACYLGYLLISKKEKVKSVLIKFVTCILIYMVVTNLTMLIIRNAGIVENKSETGTFYKFVIGLDYTSDGRWSERAYIEYVSQDKSELRNYEINKIKESLFNTHVIKLFYNKMDIFWNDFDNYWSIGYLSEETEILPGITAKEGANFIILYDKIIWMLIIILAIYSLKENQLNENKFYTIYLIGAFLVYLLIEVQGRYAFTYRPFVFILAATGLEKIFEKLNKKKMLDKGI